MGEPLQSHKHFFGTMPKARTYVVIKRIIDVLMSVVLLVALSPLFILFAVIIACEMQSCPFFAQQRGLTLERGRFRIFKFRTMKIAADSISPSGSRMVFNKPFLASYVSPFCAWLRCTGLDELPQLWNILKGNMSFIGPRPLSLVDLAIIKNETPELYKRRNALHSKPGLSGLWQLFGERNAGIENLLAFDLEYDRSRSLAVDMNLIAETVPRVILALHSDAVVRSQKVRFGSEHSRKKNSIVQNQGGTFNEESKRKHKSKYDKLKTKIPNLLAINSSFFIIHYFQLTIHLTTLQGGIYEKTRNYSFGARLLRDFAEHAGVGTDRHCSMEFRRNICFEYCRIASHNSRRWCRFRSSHCRLLSDGSTCIEFHCVEYAGRQWVSTITFFQSLGHWRLL